MIDSLLQFLLEEVAMDGDAGTSVASLGGFVEQFYDRASSGLDQPSTSDGTRAQRVDDAFLSFVWEALLSQPGVRVGVLSQLAVPAANEPKVEEQGKQDSVPPADGGDAEEAKTAKDKRKKKKIERKAQGPTHEVRIIEGDEREEGRAALQERYGDSLRILAGEETAWVAITGSHARPTSLTPTIYAVLQMISRGRDEGTTAVRISKEMGIDPKSVFHYIKIPQQLGIIKKFSDIDEGCRTNRVVHVRYLSTSAAWAAHIASEPDVKEEEDGEEDGEDGADAGFGGGWDGTELTPISTLYLTTNVPLIRKRVVKALKRRKDWWMPHWELHSAIGLHTANSRELRRLNSIVSVMANEGIVEKIAVTKKRSATQSSVVQALRLLKPEDAQEGANGSEALASDEDAQDDEHACPVAYRSLERQILDLLMDAGSRGLTNFEISSALGAYPVRFIDVLLQRFGRYRPPAPSADYTIHSVHETIGRVKQTRWFSLVGYLSFRRSRGFPDEDMEAQWREIADSASLGGWLTPEGEGPAEGQYGSNTERHACLAKFNLWATTAKSVTGVSKKPKKAPAKKRKAAAIEAADGVEQPADGAADEVEEDGSPPPKRQKAVIGRPRKHPLKPGEETYYMRKKREKAEDEERARQGLPPIERPKAKNARKKPPKKKEAEQAVDAATGDGEAGASGSPQAVTPIDEPPAATPTPAKKRGRAPKKKDAPAETADGNEPATEPSTPQVPVTPATKPRKRARTAVAAESSAPATPAAPTAPKTKPTTRQRLEPYIDIPQSSVSKKKKSVVKKALDALAGIHSSSPPRGDRPASPTLDTSDKRIEQAANAQPAEAPAEASAQPAAEPAASGAPAHEPPATPAATPASIGRNATSATPVLPTPASKKKPATGRPSVSSRANLTLLARQQEVVDYVQAQGGVLEYTYRLNEALYVWGQKQNPPRHGYVIDRANLKQVLEAATSSGQLRKTVVTDSKSQRHDVFYLTSLASDSAIVKNYLDDIANRDPHDRFTRYEVQPDLVVMSDEDVPTKEKQEDDAGAKSTFLPDPQPTDGQDRVRSFFRHHQTLLGRSHGVKHGLVARARQLHKWLASLVFSHVDEKDIVVKRDEDGFVIAQSTLLNSMPLGVFLRIVPLPVQSETLDAFLAEPDKLELPMRDVPKEIADIIRPRSNKRKQSLWKDLQILIDLQLLTPLVMGTLATTRSVAPTFEVPTNPKACTHWLFRARAPIYALRDPALPLVDVCPVTDIDEVLYFWNRLHSVSTDPSYDDAGHALDDPVFPATCPTRHLRKPELLRPFKWRDSYELAPSQRTFLNKLAHHDPGLTDPDADRTVDLEAWAACLLAPTNVVKDYLVKIRDQEAEELVRPKRKKRKTDGAGGGAGDEDEAGADEAKTPTNLAAALARKVREAADQRERDWQVIVERFRQEHGHPDLDESVVDWLHKTFQDPHRRDKLDAKQLDFELRRLLPAGQNAPTDPSMRTIVPTSLQQKARLAKDPYAIKRQPNIRRRPVVKRVRAKQATPAKEPAEEADEEEDEEAAGSPLPAQEPLPAEGRTTPLPFRRGDQTEFLTNPLGPRPDLPAGKRASRSRYTPEQDDLLLDAVAVLKVRALHLRAPRPSYNPLGDFFSGNKADALAKRAGTLLKRQQERDFHERLVSTWFNAYKEHKDELEDPNPHSLVDFDLASFIRCMRTHVNKRALRLMGPLPPPLVKADPLPDSLDAFSRFYHVKPALEAVHSGRQFEKVWTKHQIAMNEREEAAVMGAYAKRWTDEPVKADAHDCKHNLAMSAIKAIMTMEEDSYVPAQGVAMLSPFSTAEAKAALDELSAKAIAAQLDKEHRLPGRNFAFDDRFFERLSFHLDLAHLQTASHLEQDLQHDEGGVFPLVPTEGEMMALFDFVSDDKVELEVNLGELTEKTLDFLDYRTRQANDDDIECTVNISQPAGLSGKTVLLQPSFLPSTSADDADSLEGAKVTLSAIGRTLEAQLFCDIEAAGEVGLPFKSLMARHEDRGREALLAAIKYLTAGPQPLAFFAGTSALVLVSNVHAASWTLQPVLHDGVIDTSRRFLPTMWTNAMGEVDQELWQRAGAWVKGELWRFADQTYPSLLARATRLHILSAVDLQVILTAFLHAGKVLRRSPSTGALLAADDLVDWDLDTWSFAGAFW